MCTLVLEAMTSVVTQLATMVQPYCTATWPPSVMTEIKQFVHVELCMLEERVRQLEEASKASTSSAGNFSDEDNSVLPPALHSLTREQKPTIDMILWIR